MAREDTALDAKAGVNKFRTTGCLLISYKQLAATFSFLEERHIHPVWKPPTQANGYDKSQTQSFISMLEYAQSTS